MYHKSQINYTSIAISIDSHIGYSSPWISSFDHRKNVYIYIYIYIYIYMCVCVCVCTHTHSEGGDGSVMVTNPGRGRFISHSTNTIGKGMNPIILPIGK